MKLYGVLHNLEDGKLTVRQPKLLKVAIGLGAKCKDVHVHIGPTGDWILTVGGKLTKLANKVTCVEAYRQALASAPERRAPKKLPYFTFTRPGPEGYEPDFDAIEAHGPMPKEIEIALYGTLDEIFRPEYQQWGTRELQCHGDGAKAQRLATLARTPEEKARCVEGQRYFPIEGCCLGGCKAAQGDTPACKPHASFYFQLVNFPVTGGSISYDTTGYAGIKALGSVLENCIVAGESVDGMLFTMGLKAYVPRKGSGTAYHATLRPVATSVGGLTPPAIIIPPSLEMLTPEEMSDAAQAYNAEFVSGGAEV